MQKSEILSESKVPVASLVVAVALSVGLAYMVQPVATGLVLFQSGTFCTGLCGVWQKIQIWLVVADLVSGAVKIPVEVVERSCLVFLIDSADAAEAIATSATVANKIFFMLSPLIFLGKNIRKLYGAPHSLQRPVGTPLADGL